MKNITFKHHPQEYTSSVEEKCFPVDKKEDEQKLLNMWEELHEDFCIDVFSDKGNKTPTSYKCMVKGSVGNPKKIEDFEFELIDL